MDLYAYRDIEFIDAAHGWIVGGDDKAFPMQTADSGRTWAGDTVSPIFLRNGYLFTVSFGDTLHGIAA